METIKEVTIVSKKEVGDNFEYAIRLQNRRMYIVVSDRDLTVGNKVYIMCNYFCGECSNIVFA